MPKGVFLLLWNIFRIVALDVTQIFKTPAFISFIVQLTTQSEPSMMTLQNNLFSRAM